MNDKRSTELKELYRNEAHKWRMKTLRPEAANFWIEILNRAEPIARDAPRKRSCDYSPWTEAVGQIAETNKYWTTQPIYELDLMSFAECVSRPVWPEEHAHLVDFTLRFLEADVMLFRSGYIKKLLLKRVKRAKLDAQQVERIHALLRRAVLEGTGLEEFREFCRLAARVVTDDLRTWLTQQADGVFITLDDRYGQGIFYWLEMLGEDKVLKLGMIMFLGRAEYFFSAEPPHTIVKVKDLPEDNRAKLNAWRILMHLKRMEK